MALRVLEFDHFENEEAFVVTVVAERMSEAQQLEVARRLLIDEEGDDPRWIIDWVASELDDDQRKLLSDLEGRFSAGQSKESKRWWWPFG
jgi:recombinational DNA repair ATPase RecF